MHNPPLDLLRCPATKSPLVSDGDRLVSTDPTARLAYPIRDEVPVLLVEAGIALTEQEWEDVMRRRSPVPEESTQG